MTIETRIAGPDDAAIVGALIDAMDTHYRGAGQTRGVDAAVAMVHRSFADDEGARFIIALADGRPTGLACFGIMRPGALLEGLIFLKDVFVCADRRHQGVGSILMRAVAAFAIDNGIGRIDLNTSHDNMAARQLYDKLGGEASDVIRYRFADNALAKLASG